MNTQLNIKTRQLLVSPTFLTLLLGVVVMLALGGPTVQAQTAIDAPVDSSVTIPAKGTVSDPNGSITVSGSVVINCRRVIDTTSTTSPSLILLDLDLSGLQGTSGNTKATLKTYVTGGNHAEEIRPLQASDTIIVTSPYYDSTKGALTAKTMLVTATLNFDVSTGKVTGGTISIGDNVVTKAAVGSFSTTTTSSTPQ
jgi:hypothetical protein